MSRATAPRKSILLSELGGANVVLLNLAGPANDAPSKRVSPENFAERKNASASNLARSNRVEPANTQSSKIAWPAIRTPGKRITTSFESVLQGRNCARSNLSRHGVGLLRAGVLRCPDDPAKLREQGVLYIAKTGSTAREMWRLMDGERQEQARGTA